MTLQGTSSSEPLLNNYLTREWISQRAHLVMLHRNKNPLSGDSFHWVIRKLQTFCLFLFLPNFSRGQKDWGGERNKGREREEGCTLILKGNTILFISVSPFHLIVHVPSLLVLPQNQNCCHWTSHVATLIKIRTNQLLSVTYIFPL